MASSVGCVDFGEYAAKLEEGGDGVENERGDADDGDGGDERGDRETSLQFRELDVSVAGLLSCRSVGVSACVIVAVRCSAIHLQT